MSPEEYKALSPEALAELRAEATAAFKRTREDTLEIGTVLQKAWVTWAMKNLAKGKEGLNMSDMAIAAAGGFALAINGVAANLALNGFDDNAVRSFASLTGLEVAKYISRGSYKNRHAAGIVRGEGDIDAAAVRAREAFDLDVAEPASKAVN